MKVLNLYSSIGGNRKLWQNVEVTAVEQNAEIAKIYQDFFPNDNMIIGDAHKYLLEHFAEYDFIWSSPPCQTHSKLSYARMKNDDIRTGSYLSKPKYIDMTLYQEITFLKHFAKGLYVVENVQPYYKPIIPANFEINRHYFWTNFYINKINIKKESDIANGTVKDYENLLGFDLANYKGKTKKATVLRNCVLPEIGMHIFNCAIAYEPPIQEGLFGTDS